MSALASRTPCLLQMLCKNNEPFEDGFLGTPPRVSVVSITAFGALVVNEKCGCLNRAQGGRQEERENMKLPCLLSLHPTSCQSPYVAWVLAQPLGELLAPGPSFPPIE